MVKYGTNTTVQNNAKKHTCKVSIIDFYFFIIIHLELEFKVKMSKKIFIENIISHVNDHNPGLPINAKILCSIIAVSAFFEEIIGEVQDTDDSVWQIMFITVKYKDGYKKYVKGKKKDVRKMFDYCLNN